MAKKTIAIDIDDVLAVSAQSFVAFSNKKWGTNLTVDDYTEDWLTLWAIEREEAIKRGNHWHESGEQRQFKRRDNAEKVIRKLADKYRLVVTTSRRLSIQQDTLDWIDEHFNGLFQEVRFAGMWDKVTPESHTATKLELLEEIGADYLIDDHPKHCIPAAQAGITALLFGDYSWNRHTKLIKNMVRVRDWREVEEYFDGLD